MRYIQELKEGAAVKDVYLCKQKNAATTKNGKEYYNVILQDKTGTIDAKIWDTGNYGIAEFSAHDYVYIYDDPDYPYLGNYNVYFFDTETMTLYYFHNNI